MENNCFLQAFIKHNPIPMIRYLNSPLKIAGILLSLCGILLLTLTHNFYGLLGISITLMGMIVLGTEWMLQKSISKNKRRLGFELFLICIIGIFAMIIILDYLGIISMHNFM